MYKKLAKKLLLGLLTVALLLTTVAVMPANTQAASKKAKKATISAEYKTPNYCLYGQLGFLKKYPVQLKVSEVVSNRNKKATYTFYAEKKKYLTISKKGKITGIKGYKDGQTVNVIVKETYKKKTRKVGVAKFTATYPKILNKKVTWYVGQSYSITDDYWFPNKYAADIPDTPTYAGAHFAWASDDESMTQDKIDKDLRQLNGEETNDSNGESEYFDWDRDNCSFKIKEAGNLHFAFYALNFTTNKYYYVGQFDATLIKCTTPDQVNIEDEDWEVIDGNYCEIGKQDELYFNISPYYYVGDIKVTTSDPSIATVSYDSEDDGWVVNGLKKGTVTITVDANVVKDSIKYYIMSKEDFDELYDEYDDEW